MKHLSESDKSRIIQSIKAGTPLSETDVQLLMPEDSEPKLYWSKKRCRPLPESTLQYPSNFNSTDSDTNSHWINQVFHGDCLSVLSVLGSKPLQDKIVNAGGIKLVYMDPPFDVGSDFKLKHSIGPSHQKTKFRPIAYRDSWSQHATELLNMLYSCFSHIHPLLAEDGTLYVHCDWRLSGVIRLMLDEVFGKAQLRNEICWRYNSRTMASQWFARKHDTIFVYSKGPSPIFNGDAVRIPHKPESKSQYNKMDAEGRFYKPQSNGKRSYLNPLGQPCSDVWDIQLLGSRTPERSGYPTQKPLALLERMIKASSNEGDIVADLFCGSGVLAEAADKLNRRWLVADIGSLAIQTTTKRLLSPTIDATFRRSETNSDRMISKDIDWNKMLGLRLGLNTQIVVETKLVTVQRLQQIVTNFPKKDLIVLAINFDTECLQWAHKNRNKYSVSLKIIPRGQLYFQPKHPVFFMPALCAEIQSIQSQKGFQFSIRNLYFIDHHPQVNTPFTISQGHLYETSTKSQTANQLTQSWSDWIEGWSIDQPIHDEQNIIWHQFRTQNSRVLECKSPFLTGITQSHIVVTLYDIFGYTHRQRLTLLDACQEMDK